MDLSVSRSPNFPNPITRLYFLHGLGCPDLLGVGTTGLSLTAHFLSSPEKPTSPTGFSTYCSYSSGMLLWGISILCILFFHLRWAVASLLGFPWPRNQMFRFDVLEPLIAFLPWLGYASQAAHHEYPQGTTVPDAVAQTHSSSKALLEATQAPGEEPRSHRSGENVRLRTNHLDAGMKFCVLLSHCSYLLSFPRQSLYESQSPFCYLHPLSEAP